MSALREWAATLGGAAKAAVAVNAWGKWKTATQVNVVVQTLLEDTSVSLTHTYVLLQRHLNYKHVRSHSLLPLQPGRFRMVHGEGVEIKPAVSHVCAVHCICLEQALVVTFHVLWFCVSQGACITAVLCSASCRVHFHSLFRCCKEQGV